MPHVAVRRFPSVINLLLSIRFRSVGKILLLVLSADILDLSCGVHTGEIVVGDRGVSARVGFIRHLVDTDKCAQVERLFGRISSRKVYYRGPDFIHPSGVEYLNVEKYLKNL